MCTSTLTKSVQLLVGGCDITHRMCTDKTRVHGQRAMETGPDSSFWFHRQIVVTCSAFRSHARQGEDEAPDARKKHSKVRLRSVTKWPTGKQHNVRQATVALQHLFENAPFLLKVRPPDRTRCIFIGWGHHTTEKRRAYTAGHSHPGNSEWGAFTKGGACVHNGCYGTRKRSREGRQQVRVLGRCNTRIYPGYPGIWRLNTRAFPMCPGAWKFHTLRYTAYLGI